MKDCTLIYNAFFILIRALFLPPISLVILQTVQIATSVKSVSMNICKVTLYFWAIVIFDHFSMLILWKKVNLPILFTITFICISIEIANTISLIFL